MNEIKEKPDCSPKSDEGELKDPTENDLQDPLFEIIWQAIKGWDIERSQGEGYAGATGTDVMTILNAIRPHITRLLREKKEVEKMITEVRPFADAYKRVCEQLGIKNDIMGYTETLKAVLARTTIFEKAELADLAFRLSPAKNIQERCAYHRALRSVYQSFRKKQEGTALQNMVSYETWLESFITPIEKVVAALIARELEKERKRNE